MPPKPRLTPEALVRASIEKYSAADQKLFRALRRVLRQQFPTANELAYDYGHSAMLTYTPTEHGMQGIVSLALRDEGVRLYLSNAKKLKDPTKRLRGTATVRYVEIASRADFNAPDVQALVAAAVAVAKPSFPTTGKGQLHIRTTRNA